jgi:hypothetical protein
VEKEEAMTCITKENIRNHPGEIEGKSGGYFEKKRLKYIE